MEEEIIIDVKYVNAVAERMMLIDSGAPKSKLSKKWLEGYLKVSDEDVKKRSCTGHLKLGRTVYLSSVEVEFPVVMKTDEIDFVKRRIVTNVIESDEINFL